MNRIIAAVLFEFSEVKFMLLDFTEYISENRSDYFKHTQAYIETMLERRGLDLDHPLRTIDLGSYGLEMKLIDGDQVALGDIALKPVTKAGETILVQKRDELRSLNPVDEGYLRLDSGLPYSETVNALHRAFPNGTSNIERLADIMVMRVREDIIARPYAERLGFKVLLQQISKSDDGDNPNLVFKRDEDYVYSNGNGWTVANVDKEGNEQNPSFFPRLDEALASLDLAQTHLTEKKDAPQTSINLDSPPY